MSAEQEINKGMVTLKIVWFAMLTFLVVYLVVGRMVAPSMPSSISGEAFNILRTALYVIGFFTLIAAGYIRRLIRAGNSQVGGLGQTSQSTVIQKYTSAVIISLAMCESIGICGLVLFILGKNTTDLYLLLGISAVAMIYYRPKKDELVNLSQKILEGSNYGQRTDQ